VKIRFLELLIVLSLFGCSTDTSQTKGLGPTTQPATAASVLPPAGAGTSSTQSTPKPPVPGSRLALKGKLVYPTGILTNTSLLIEVDSLDLSSGKATSIFQAPAGGSIDAAMVSPDGKQLLLAYQPPPGTEYGTQEALYVMPLDASHAPTLLFPPTSKIDRYYQPSWSPDGSFIYFTHGTYGSTIQWEIMRMAYPGGKPERLADHAYWPSVSSDGKRLVFVSVDPATGKDHLFSANADGTQAGEVAISGLPTPGIIDAPIFLAGNESILFSAPPAQHTSEPSLTERLLGISVAFAHASVESEWWVVPAAGGAATQLTQLHATGLFASLSPDGQYVASYSSNSIVAMKPDGTSVTALMSWIAGIPGTVSWVP
jgi:Tol biopolymer transport system component